MFFFIISAIDSLISNKVFLIFSISFLKCSWYTYIICLNSVNIFFFITNALNSSSGKLFMSVLSFIFSWLFFCSSIWEQFLFLFILLIILCLYELGETVTYCSLEGLLLCGSILYGRLCIPSAFGWRAWFWCGHKSHPQYVVEATILVRGGAGDRGAWAEAWGNTNFLSSQWLSPP